MQPVQQPGNLIIGKALQNLVYRLIGRGDLLAGHVRGIVTRRPAP
jgi:hypothetical protein